MLLRPATLHDLDALQAIERSATELYDAQGFSPGQVLPRGEADMRLLLKFTTVLVAADDDGPVGYVSFYARGPFLHLEEIAVRRDRQRRGIGRALVQQYLRAAERDPQCTHLSLVAFRRAPWALALYGGLGFRFLPADADLPHVALLRELAELEAAADRSGEPRVVMVRPVADPA
jgi:ribosomal protein S18 acetylase RimI-like enzyme